MNRNKLKSYAPQARREFIEAVTARAAHFGLTATKTEPMTGQGDVVLIAGRPFPKAVGEKRKKLEARVQRQGFGQTMEAMAYTWFNRLVAMRFMELHGYLDHGYRVLSHPAGHTLPEIVEHAEHVDLPGLNKQKVIELKLDGTKEDELYRLLLLAQCNALNKAMPFLFESIDDETELLLPDHLLHSDSLIRKLVEEIPEEDWQAVEIIGWLYQFYISEKKDEVIGKVVKSEDIPAATQLFTPNWIVKYLVQNSLGRQWVATYSTSTLKSQMEYYIELGEQTPEVQAKLADVAPKSLNPEELTVLDPACGSGHILVEAYDLFKAIYQERGYRAKDIPRLILEKNLFGLEIDDRAAQLAAFALIVKARADDRNIFALRAQPHVLSIQESKGLDAREITEALNQPILKEELPPSGELFEELVDENSPLFSKKMMGSKGGIPQADVAHLIDLFEHGKTFGSLIQVPKTLADRLPAIAQRVEDVIAHGEMFDKSAARVLRPFVQQARMLAAKYEAVVTNPPYMGGRNGMNSQLKAFAARHFPETKADLFAAFIEQGLALCKSRGHCAMVTMQSWMFLSSFEQMRQRLLTAQTLLTMAHLGPRAFGSISGEVVQTTAFVFLNIHIQSTTPVCFRLVDGDESAKQEALLQRRNRFDNVSQDDFMQIPGTPLAYWMPHALVLHLTDKNQLLNFSDQRQGLATGDDDTFLRYWHEIDVSTFNNVNLPCPNNQRKWFPFIKGGSFRKWYGNNEFVIRFDDTSYETLANQGNCLPNKHLYMKESLVWSDVAASVFGARFNDEGKVFATGALSAFPKRESWKWYILGYLNSCIHDLVINSISSGLHYHTGYVSKCPLLIDETVLPTVSEVVEEAVAISRRDWDASETSWEFSVLPAFGDEVICPLVFETIEKWMKGFLHEFQRLMHLERENNRLFLAVYGLENDMDSNVADSNVTLSEHDPPRCIRRVLSYSIGCMMGRYSLDEPGLIYAKSGNQGFDPAKYRKFPADEDGIIPLTEFNWFADDAASRFEEFIATAWPGEHLEENLTFVAENLGAKKGESPRETVRRYLAADFFKHHLSMYKRRPIYWLFSSGRQRGFQALVYLHRYNEGTLARMRTEYVIPLMGKMTARIKQLTDDSAAATSSQHKKRLETEKAILVKQLAEVQAFDERLRHYADQRIKLDLDDGVKVNYGKFGDLLAEVKAICGSNNEE